MTWTPTLPVAAGWYWLRAPGHDAAVVELAGRTIARVGEPGVWHPPAGALWAGPLAPPPTTPGRTFAAGTIPR